MYICSCKAVTDRTINVTLAAGARSIDDVARMCAAGSACGGCRPAITKLIDHASAARIDGDQDSSAA